MGFRDNDLPDSFELFSTLQDPGAIERLRINKMFNHGNGRPLVRIDQIDAFYEEAMDTPALRMEYDRFTSGLKKKQSIEG